MKFDLNDILIEPAVLSNIRSRSEINVYNNDLMLPLITAPMDTVISEDNVYFFKKNKIISIIPRNDIKENIENTSINKWKAISLENFANYINLDYFNNNLTYYILIDIANGHMEYLYNLCKICKERYSNINLMIGNIGNPETYRKYCELGVWGIRLSIGSGNGCLTGVQTGIGYPIASLISECYNISLEYNNAPKIIADGGMKCYSDIIKCLCLGADYVMIGSLFNKAIESAAPTYIERFGKMVHVNQYKIDSKQLKKHNYKKLYRGMSTKEVQIEMGNSKLKTSEGIVKYNNVEYTLEGWTENFIDYLKSSMSYAGKKTLKEFIGETKYNIISYQSYLRINK